MTAPALPAFRQAARRCASLGCPNVLSVADGAYCLACKAEQARAGAVRLKYTPCYICERPASRGGLCVRCWRESRR